MVGEQCDGEWLSIVGCVEQLWQQMAAFIHRVMGITWLSQGVAVRVGGGVVFHLIQNKHL